MTIFIDQIFNIVSANWNSHDYLNIPWVLTNVWLDSKPLAHWHIRIYVGIGINYRNKFIYDALPLLASLLISAWGAIFRDTLLSLAQRFVFFWYPIWFSSHCWMCLLLLCRLALYTVCLLWWCKPWWTTTDLIW